MKPVSRRDFLKFTGLGAAFAAGTVGELLNSESGYAVEARPAEKLRILGATETTTVCCYCSVGCGGICSVADGKLVNFEGDPDNPLNRGGMCSKGIAQFNVLMTYDPETGELGENPGRVLKPLYRAKGATEWQEITWDKAIKDIARRVKDERDKSFIEKNEKGETVNRLETIACLGGAALDNEECAVYQKLARSLGVVYLEHQARI